MGRYDNILAIPRREKMSESCKHKYILDNQELICDHCGIKYTDK